MNTAIRSVLDAAAILAAVCCLASTALAEDGGGISSPLISRCAGKLGSQLRQGDQAFPLLSLDGVPWAKIERSDQEVAGVRIAATVTGTGARHRRRGQVVGFRYKCLVDDKGDAVAFSSSDLLPERKESLPPATLVSGSAFYQPRIQLPSGVELRVQLLDVTSDTSGNIMTEVAVRSSWEEPIPFVLRLPPETNLEGRKMMIAARLALGATTLYRISEPRVISADELQRPIKLVLDAVGGSP